jgi:hypothetical protein
MARLIIATAAALILAVTTGAAAAQAHDLLTRGDTGPDRRPRDPLRPRAGDG